LVVTGQPTCNRVAMHLLTELANQLQHWLAIS
jgi:hypothetical protein